MSGARNAYAAAVLAVALCAAPAARAQLFSPGPLSKAHEALEGLTGCTQCHIEGGRHDNNKCLACHKEIARRIDAHSGYHNSVRARQCATCHREHRGLKANLIEWTPSKESFNHSLTGWPLLGNHKKPSCNDCHEPRRIDDGSILKLIAKGRRNSMLGLAPKCSICHFDEHRGQEGKSCERCHTPEQKFKSAPLFNHNNRKLTDYRLIGKHRRVQCKECHEQRVDTKTPASSFPKPLDASYMQMKDVPHGQCTACHDDVHRGTFGKGCDRCHTPIDWKVIREGAQDTGFHDKHRFKLRGEHRSVACKSCHGPFRNRPAKFRGLKFARCSDCHIDAHVGQLKNDHGAPRCEDCHTVAGFLPVLFNVDMHDKTRFPLEGSHRTVACGQCHKDEPRLKERVPRSVRIELANQGRPLLVSTARLLMPGIVADPLDARRSGKNRAPADCEGCHEDVHKGQFKKPAGKEGEPHVDKKLCSDCHKMTTFADLSFNHDDSRFPLTGKHKDVDCGACHTPPPARRGEDRVVPYRPLDASCASCHADVHVGQLAKNGVTDCAICHATTGFKPAKFDHDKQSTFPLVGQHKKAKCVSCHAVVKAGKKEIARYKPLPADCAGCHEDEHKHAFDDFNPKLPPPPMAQFARVTKSATDSKCDGCHTPNAWVPAGFAHERTGFPLTGEHAKTRCTSCHGQDYRRRVPATCAACHIDPHAQEFGLMCQSCHDTTVFRGPDFPVDAHRRTNFPLTGRHAALPCDECHIEKRERGFTRAALDCTACHANDARAATAVTVNHSAPPFAGVSCGTCHVPATFTGARFDQHEKCFPISRGVHAPIHCTQCHKALSGAVADGKCDGVPVLCAECHDHAAVIENARHSRVPGYEHKSEKCAGCHQPG